MAALGAETCAPPTVASHLPPSPYAGRGRGGDRGRGDRGRGGRGRGRGGRGRGDGEGEWIPVVRADAFHIQRTSRGAAGRALIRLRRSPTFFHVSLHALCA